MPEEIGRETFLYLGNVAINIMFLNTITWFNGNIIKITFPDYFFIKFMFEIVKLRRKIESIPNTSIQFSQENIEKTLGTSALPARPQATPCSRRPLPPVVAGGDLAAHQPFSLSSPRLPKKSGVLRPRRWYRPPVLLRLSVRRRTTHDHHRDTVAGKASFLVRQPRIHQQPQIRTL